MKINFTKGAGLIPAIVQDAMTRKVLMLGFMNEEAYALTQSSQRVTFFSRSRNRLWTKGETSGNYLVVQEILLDCDADTILIKARPVGPVCHTGEATCFNEENSEGSLFLDRLQDVIADRRTNLSSSSPSYTSSLFASGLDRIAQKVGEEAVEVVIESKNNDSKRFVGEAADLLFHLSVLLQAKGVSLGDVIDTLKARHLQTNTN